MGNLNFGQDMFPQSGLLQEDGLLSERWGQEDSDVINIVGLNNSDNTVYTVTTGKVLYIISLAVSVNAVGNGEFKFRDGGAGGTILYNAIEGNDKTYQPVTFGSPLKFETDIYNEETTPCGSRINLYGWEEDA